MLGESLKGHTMFTLDDLDVTRVIELSHELRRGIPNHASHPPYEMVPYYRAGDFEMDGGYGGSNELLLMSGHSGTHLDALGHVTQNGQGFQGHRLDELNAGLNGLGALGIETVKPILRRGVLIDVAGHRGIMAGETAPVDASEIKDICRADGIALRQGDCVLLHTGWSRFWSDPAGYMGVDTGTPGVSADGADYLCRAGAFLMGGETAVVEHQAPGSHSLPVHMLALARAGVHLLENMDLSALAATGVREFVFLCLPLRLVGATGSPVRPVALIV